MPLDERQRPQHRPARHRHQIPPRAATNCRPPLQPASRYVRHRLRALQAQGPCDLLRGAHPATPSTKTVDRLIVLAGQTRHSGRTTSARDFRRIGLGGRIASPGLVAGWEPVAQPASLTDVFAVPSWSYVTPSATIRSTTRPCRRGLVASVRFKPHRALVAPI